MSEAQWVSIRNTISAPDLARIRRTMKALETEQTGGGAEMMHNVAVTKQDNGSNAKTIAGGARCASPPSPRCRSTTYRVFYRVASNGRKMGDAKYQVTGTSLKPLAEELMESALRRATHHTSPLSTIPASVHQAVDEAVEHRVITPHQGAAFIKKYQRYGKATEHASIYLREQGKRSIKEFEGCYRMLKHPSHADVVNGRVRRMAVEYVGTLRR